MVVGHTPQFNGRILPRCSNELGQPQFYVIDVAISSAYNSAGSGALEILYYDNDGIDVEVRALYLDEKVRFY